MVEHAGKAISGEATDLHAHFLPKTVRDSLQAGLSGVAPLVYGLTLLAALVTVLLCVRRLCTNQEEAGQDAGARARAWGDAEAIGAGVPMRPCKFTARKPSSKRGTRKHKHRSSRDEAADEVELVRRGVRFGDDDEEESA